MPLRVVYDTSVILAQMTPVPEDGSIIWHWMVDGSVGPVVSDYLVLSQCWKGRGRNDGVWTWRRRCESASLCRRRLRCGGFRRP